jgi:hypothetical protein
MINMISCVIDIVEDSLIELKVYQPNDFTSVSIKPWSSALEQIPIIILY